jgi:hypothetical protein
MKVLVVGGAKPRVTGNFQRKLNEVGIEILWHVPNKTPKRYKGIPSSAEGVLIIKDMIDHSLSGKVLAEAKSREEDIKAKGGTFPWALIDCLNWPDAEATLKDRGFIKPVAAPAPSPTLAEIQKRSVLDYICEIRGTGRNPTLEEVQTRYAGVTPDIYKASLSIAAKTTPLAKVVTDAEIQSLISAVLSEDYELILDGERLSEAAKAAFPNLAANIHPLQVGRVILDTQAEWKSHKDVRREATYKWLVQRFRKFKDTGKGWISFDDNRGGGIIQQIFGAVLHSDKVCEARAEVYGEWARKLISPMDAGKFFATIRPDCPGILCGWTHLIVKGDLQGIMVDRKTHGVGYHTSEKAVQAYADKFFPLTKKVEEPVKKMPQPQREGIIARMMEKDPTLTRDIAERRIEAYLNNKLAEKLAKEPEVIPAVPDVTPTATPEPEPLTVVHTSMDSSAPAAPTPIDLVGFAELVETGVSLKLQDLWKLMDERWKEESDRSVAALATLKAEITTMVGSMVSVTIMLTEAIGKLSERQVNMIQEVRSLRESIKTIPPVTKSPDMDKATALGMSILNAQHAEVHTTYGEKKV